MTVPDQILGWLDQQVARSLPVWRRASAPQLFVGSFLGLVLVGTLLLYLLPGIYTGERLGFVDALFTATSAVCVTGLIVVDTATYFTPFGQAVLLGLLQLGGLGILSLTTLLVLVTSGRISLRSEEIAGASDAMPYIDPGQLIRNLVRYTLITEAVGALLLYLVWIPRFGAADAAWPALFHAISAFCNAGFSIFSDNMVGFAGSIPTLSIIGALIVIGGLGSFVLTELRLRYSQRGRRLSVHTRLVLVTTAVLLAGGSLLFLFFEWQNVLAGRSLPGRITGALFLAITPRTAGFNTVDYALLTPASLFLTIVLMMIGGSPGSTAGGLKTTTFALLALLAWSRLRGQQNTDAFRRTIPDRTAERAVGLVVAVLAFLGATILLLLLTELGGEPFALQGGLMQIAFEVTSAFNTVGLSTGITPALSTPGKVIVCVLMFVGRVGPLTLVASMVAASHRRTMELRHATEDVFIG